MKTLPRIVIEAVAQRDMRPPYDQQEEGGDWFYNDDGELVVRVIGEDIGKPEVFLFALHELVEAYLCRVRGISQQRVDNFDRYSEGAVEPGDDPASPYRREHRFAMLIEHLLAYELGIPGYGTVE